MAVQVDHDTETMRQRALEAAKKHKASWIELGQFLFSIHKDKYFKSWGFLSFETYCVKELGMKSTTAAKLLKSYSFLEKEEPRVIDPRDDGDSPSKVPNFESVNLLRLARENQKLTPQDYAEVRESVIEKAREPQEVRAQVKKLLSERDPVDPADVRKQRRNSAIRRVITVITMAKKELENESLLPKFLIQQMNELTSKLQDQIED
ncbi:MAG TPA: hypothetical protein VL688_08440 [Verrucomicrobiae bacterium]|jgi:hypothetical protein|nr:hypothetical protein [Verrucomicrobiae bacterium]